MKPTHPQAESARRQMMALRAHHVLTGDAALLDGANELRDCADTIDSLYHQANLFIPKPRLPGFLRRRRHGATA